jgi:hypothetical protein
LERDGALAALTDAHAAAATGEGRVAFVTGEPGIGKTSLVNRFVRSLEPDARVLLGTCDDLSIPRPLGPFRDLVGTVSPALDEAMADGAAPHDIRALLIAELELSPRPTVLVLEDIHWADDATFDSVAVVGRRIGSIPALLVLTFRAGEAPPGHPLHATVGAIRARDSVTLKLAPLSADAVASLAGDGADQVYAATGGNPFYVTELLASRTAAELPPSIANAVLGRAARLDDAGRRLAELVSVVPTRVRASLLDAVMPGWAAAAVEPQRRRLLDVDASYVRFRHELARHAIRSSLPVAERRRLHARILAALLEEDADPADIVHHAEAAGAEDVVAAYALVAARRAAALESNREAVLALPPRVRLRRTAPGGRAGAGLRGARDDGIRRRPSRRRVRRDRACDRDPRQPRRPRCGRALHARALAVPLVRRRRRGGADAGARRDRDPRAAGRIGRAGAGLQRPLAAGDARRGSRAGVQLGRAGARPRDTARRRANPGARADQHGDGEAPARSDVH